MPRSEEPNAWLLDVKSPVSEQVEFIHRRRREDGVTAITTYPTNALMLAQDVLDRGIDMGFIGRLGLMSEAVDASQRALMQAAFPNARIWVTYSSMEFGMISCQCPHEPEFQHIMAHKLRVEVVDDDGNQCAAGETGRVVITDYFNDLSPLIRYEIGDLAARAKCPCNRILLPAFNAVYGKVRGALLHRSGQRVPFTDLSVALRDLPGMRQYQVIQEKLDEFTVNVVAPAGIEAGIAEAFQRHFGYRPEIRVAHVSHIPRERTGKFHASICKV